MSAPRRVHCPRYERTLARRGLKYAAPTAAADEDELPTEQPSEAYRDLAEYWAPTMYQDVNTIYLTRSDIPTPFSCDGDWNGGSNRCYVL